MQLLYFLFGPLLLLVVLICADARGKPWLSAKDQGSRNGLRYIFLAAVMVTLVGLMAAIPTR
ncbi:MAG TPA: hypothetical protein VHN20_00010 [Beijerinckiaceae bacterium]|nr:hypothetical protein [Beijerinckiaceae bacterium]